MQYCNNKKKVIIYKNIIKKKKTGYVNCNRTQL